MLKKSGWIILALTLGTILGTVGAAFGLMIGGNFIMVFRITALPLVEFAQYIPPEIERVEFIDKVFIRQDIEKCRAIARVWLVPLFALFGGYTGIVAVIDRLRSVDVDTEDDDFDAPRITWDTRGML